MPIDLYDTKGSRKYLNQQERQSFEQAAKEDEREVRTFCLMLLYSGCRISEALELTVKNIDFSSKSVTFRTLKKRGDKKVYRSVPLPDYFLDELNLVHNLKKEKRENTRIWNWARATASRKVDAVMQRANIKGIHACPKGLRHGFVITCLEKQIPLNMAQKWAGHSSLTTTAIYANALGPEERNIASRLWQ
jgi:integrase/recombinase XerD